MKTFSRKTLAKTAFATVPLAFFLLVVSLAYFQAGIGSPVETPALHMSASTAISPVLYTGFQGAFVGIFARFMNFLAHLFSNNLLVAVMVLAVIVELLLLLPAIHIQLKQKKIHLFHKKLVDRFNRGELSLSDTRHEMNILYAVNEKIHAHGAAFVVIQITVFLGVLWSLNLLAHAPYLLRGAQNILNFTLLNHPANFAIPLIAGAFYFFHSLVRVYCKQKEDYISSTQSLVSLSFAIFSSALVYWASTVLPVLLTVYFVTLITVSTLRYIVVEQNAKSWGKLAQRQLIEMLRNVEVHENRFQYLSRKWNHLPVVRYINFHLLEEALSMSLGLMLAFNFFGIIVL